MDDAEPVPALVRRFLAVEGTAPVHGLALEDCVAALFARVPGVSLHARNVLHDATGCEEVDVFFSNRRHPDGFDFLPFVLPVECKNWASPVTPQSVSHFVGTLRHRSCSHGILVARSGVAGSDVGGATSLITTALHDGVRVLILTAEDLLSLESAADLVELLRRRLLDLVARGVPGLA